MDSKFVPVYATLLLAYLEEKIYEKPEFRFQNVRRRVGRKTLIN